MSDTNNNDNNRGTVLPRKFEIFRMLKVEKEFKHLLEEPEVTDDYYLEETLYTTFNDFRDNEKQNHFNSK